MWQQSRLARRQRVSAGAPPAPAKGEVGPYPRRTSSPLRNALPRARCAFCCKGLLGFRELQGRRLPVLVNSLSMPPEARDVAINCSRDCDARNCGLSTPEGATPVIWAHSTRSSLVVLEGSVAGELALFCSGP